MVKEGIWNFTFEVIELCPKDKLNNLEDYFFQKNTKKDVGVFLINTRTLNLKKIKLKKSEIFLVKFFDLYSDIKINKNQSEILSQIREYFGG